MRVFIEGRMKVYLIISWCKKYCDRNVVKGNKRVGGARDVQKASESNEVGT